jgi:hypothetical protein
LSLHERSLFANGSAEELLQLAQRCDAEHEKRSRSRRWAGSFTSAMKGLERYFKVIETVVSSHPEIAALVWGGMKFVITVRVFMFLTCPCTILKRGST